ncbi:MAG TPA: protein translocase subunit SecD [Phycisphaerales bacterium]|nr:protein translocase subunit SecD [Phycisphaerales bacterium]
MRQLYKTLVIVVAVIFLAVYAIVPPEEKLRLGKDLRGGVSLVYSVAMGPGEDPREVIPKTIEALKRRVDPDGLMEIAMVPVGDDRIEITMPLPSDRVKELKRAFESKLVALGQNRLSDSRIDQVMRLAPAERDAEIAKLSEGNANRARLLREIAAAYDEVTVKQAQRAETQDPEAQRRLISEIAAAEIKLDELREHVLKTVLSPEDIRRVVQASTVSKTITSGGQPVALPSPRETAQKELYTSHPEAKEEIDAILAAYDAYAAERKTLDDPNDLIRMLKGAGVLSFRITVDPQGGRDARRTHPEEQRLRDELQERGPRNVRSDDTRWLKINQLDGWINSKEDLDRLLEDPVNNARAYFAERGYVVEFRGGEYWMLCFDTRSTTFIPNQGEGVAGARVTPDDLGRNAIGFTMTPAGGKRLDELTRNHVNDNMAVVLDDEVYTAPNLMNAISTNGIIQGDFSDEEIDYIRRVLSGGSLQAKLSPEPISISSVGPQLGADNLHRGLRAGVISMIITAGFMVAYYWGLGLISVFSLLINALLVLAMMAMSSAAFTMPGIAGVILTFGMAVDSNVLVFERIREELQRGADMKTAVRLGFDKALSSIVDGNVTNLIVCIVLYYTGTPEIRGFAVTLGIGVVATLFAALTATRLLMNLLLLAGWRKAPMLATTVPGVQKALTPKIQWLKYRYVFFTISAIYVAVGLGMVFFQGKKMLDNEFLGGTQVTLQFKQQPGSEERVTLERPKVVEMVQAIGESAPQNDELRRLAFAEVLPINPREDGVSSDRFEIKTVATNSRAVLDAIVAKFADYLDSKPRLAFAGFENPADRAPAYPIEKPTLGANLADPRLASLRTDVSDVIGGVAIVLRDLSSASADRPVTLADLQERLRSGRLTERFSDTLARKWRIYAVEGTDSNVKTAVLVVADEGSGFFENQGKWEADLRNREWQLVQESLTQTSTPASVNSFSPTIADTFKTQAVTAVLLSFLFIGIYIWIRFKQPRYAMAAIVALVHDVLTVLGLLALAEILYENPATHGFAQSIGLLPFKINLNTVAALLTIAGYSLNDTVVVMDRIRENRGKLPYATAQVINDSINQTFSRTIITGGTTIVSCFLLYSIGGEGVRAFAFALATGMIIGTYSSVAVAAPIVWSRKSDKLPPSPGQSTGGSRRELQAAGR